MPMSSQPYERSWPVLTSPMTWSPLGSRKTLSRVPVTSSERTIVVRSTISGSGTNPAPSMASRYAFRSRRMASGRPAHSASSINPMSARSVCVCIIVPWAAASLIEVARPSRNALSRLASLPAARADIWGLLPAPTSRTRCCHWDSPHWSLSIFTNVVTRWRPATAPVAGSGILYRPHWSKSVCSGPGRRPLSPPRTVGVWETGTAAANGAGTGASEGCTVPRSLGSSGARCGLGPPCTVMTVPFSAVRTSASSAACASRSALTVALRAASALVGPPSAVRTSTSSAGRSLPPWHRKSRGPWERIRPLLVRLYSSPHTRHVPRPRLRRSAIVLFLPFRLAPHSGQRSCQCGSRVRVRVPCPGPHVQKDTRLRVRLVLNDPEERDLFPEIHETVLLFRYLITHHCPSTLARTRPCMPPTPAHAAVRQPRR